MFKKSFLLASASSLFLLTSNAWAVPVDSFDCTFTVRDSNDQQISHNRMTLDVGRKPRISNTGYQETEGKYRLVTRLPDGWSFGADLRLEYASKGTEGYQRANSRFQMCMPPLPSGKPPCMSSPIVVSIEPPGAGPYFSWRRTAVINGLPQIDPSEVETTEAPMSIDGRDVHFKLTCEYKGLTE